MGVEPLAEIIPALNRDDVELPDRELSWIHRRRQRPDGSSGRAHHRWRLGITGALAKVMAQTNRPCLRPPNHGHGSHWLDLWPASRGLQADLTVRTSGSSR